MTLSMRKAVQARLKDESGNSLVQDGDWGEKTQLAIYKFIVPECERVKAAGPMPITCGKLAIVVGHTLKEDGVYGVAPISSGEYKWNSHLAELIVQECESLGMGAKVFLRDNVGISGAYRAVEAWKPTASVELHFNGANGNARGTETLYGTTCPESKAWARMVQDTMSNLYERPASLARGDDKTGLLQTPPL